MKNVRELDDIRRDLEAMYKMPCKPDFSKPKTGDIIDEDQSVRWNREEIIKRQAAYDEEVKRLNTLKNKRRDELHKELYKAIQYEVKGISEEVAEKIYSHAWEDSHAYGLKAVFNDLNDLMELANDIIKGSSLAQSKPLSR